MANPELVEQLKKNVRDWNRMRVPPFVASGRSMDLQGADLHDAFLGGADLTGAHLNNANLRGTWLIYANLSWANLQDADLTGANIGATVFFQTNLKGVRGLDTCNHGNASALDVSTLQQSGNLPLSFLRGCGLPETLIEYLPSLLGQPIQFYSCFISYSTADQNFADRLYADLQKKGVRCWFASHHVQGGKKLHEQIDEAIRIYDRLLLILSEGSMNSEWVRTEIAHARQKEIVQGRQVLFPISLVPFSVIRDWKCFDADTGKDSAREIREYFIPDFSNWKDHDSYQNAFDRLVKDLKETGG